MERAEGGGGRGEGRGGRGRGEGRSVCFRCVHLTVNFTDKTTIHNSYENLQNEKH